MKKVCQRFCRCSEKGSFSRDPNTHQWVHTCGYPKEVWYMENAKSGEIPVVPRSRWDKPSAVVDIDKFRKQLAKRKQRALDHAKERLVQPAIRGKVTAR